MATAEPPQYHLPELRGRQSTQRNFPFSFAAETATNENQHASGSGIEQQALPEGLGLIPFRASQRKGINNPLLSGLCALNERSE